MKPKTMHFKFIFTSLSDAYHDDSLFQQVYFYLRIVLTNINSKTNAK